MMNLLRKKFEDITFRFKKPSSGLYNLMIPIVDRSSNKINKIQKNKGGNTSLSYTFT